MWIYRSQETFTDRRRICLFISIRYGNTDKGRIPAIVEDRVNDLGKFQRVLIDQDLPLDLEEVDEQLLLIIVLVDSLDDW